VANEAGYVQESLSLWGGRIQLGGGLRFDDFRFKVLDRLVSERSGVEDAGRWQPKGSAAFTPWRGAPITLYANYGRGISTADARAVVQHPAMERAATTDSYQLGTSHRLGRTSVSTDVFRIARSNEQVYIPDDGSFEFKGRSLSYGYEIKTSIEVTHKLSLNGGITKVGNAYYAGGSQRLYVDSAPHFVANAGLTITAWSGWSGSLRMRAINHYRLSGSDNSIVASGHTVFDFGVSRRIRRGVDFNLTIDNLFNREYYETQNYYESRLPQKDPIFRIHGTPGYGRTVMAGINLRLRGK
jgi:outer membrane receptor protein involved in Fe transport